MIDNGNGWKRAETDIERCHGAAPTHGQCPFAKVPGSNYCPRHGGTVALNSAAVKSAFKYRLNKFQARYEEQAGNPTIKSLRDEIGVSRVLLEEVFNKIDTEGDGDKLTMLVLLPQITGILHLIKGLVESCDKLETKFGMTLDKSQVVQIGITIVNILSQHISDEAALERVADEVMIAIVGSEAVSA